jgi:hypothetical protein
MHNRFRGDATRPRQLVKQCTNRFRGDATHRRLRVLDTTGDVGDQALAEFLAHGYTSQNALEVVLGIGTYTMSTLANRLTGSPVDDQLAAFA